MNNYCFKELFRPVHWLLLRRHPVHDVLMPQLPPGTLGLMEIGDSYFPPRLLFTFKYIQNKFAKFEKNPLKPVREADYTNFIPYNAYKLPKMTKFIL